ncbi:toprim domain-containing protein [Paenibacillus senegalensis]|uniref:toprim domain-containing protein n=1 Tax=Paenibacillus senegalensis TaxID=1465766 RepID=UPI000289E866|nr:toprim domain-containing protein [Paenibacillus senegalensis]
MSIAIIVEGKNDRKKLRKVLSSAVHIECTFGTPGTQSVERLKKKLNVYSTIYVFTDNDSSGKRIRVILGDAFPDAEPIYTRKGYAGVEGTPEEYLIEQLEKAGLEEYIIYPPPAFQYPT